ncbi:PepSY domain-containing protein [Sphingomonas sp. DG1-23]|uniref:PepSY-associated TM helix domain-containing protein n=1 Tax=Sphingomonas sp. DG1-23 TaxID=3068316 RepID=UPI00273D6653|nr:PepSY domain-containing protein [Sphingomonas sp. DG1-23]MDP5278755.1 PepSY domain-containing protein [Sphingomonas sp. DG1-23]
MPSTRWYNAVWRWHFYAGLFCMPFVLWLAATGTIYLWKPQIEAWLERSYDTLVPAGPRTSADAQVKAALAALPGATLHKYQLPQRPGEAARIIVGRHGVETRVYVDPYRLRVLGTEAESERPLRVVSDLHGTFRAGNPGSYLVEIAACWTMTMLLTGLYLWWPRRARGLGGLLYPRLHSGKRLFWRDLHAVAGIWVAIFALFLISTGLPWAKFWGSYFKEVRTITGTLDGPQDWPTGARSPMLGDHAEHGGMGMLHVPAPGAELDRIVAAVYPLGIAPPVLIAPPVAGSGAWTVSSDAANRPLRTQITVDGASGAIRTRRDFADRHWLDRAVGYGIAAHEGALFGLANQLLGTLTAFLLATLTVSGAVMWWRRRPQGLLGAPLPLSRPRYGPLLIGAVLLLALAMPLFGAPLVSVALADRLLLPRWPAARRWLGRTPIRA